MTDMVFVSEENLARALYEEYRQRNPGTLTWETDSRAEGFRKQVKRTRAFLPSVPTDHIPIKAGSSTSNMPGGYTGDWIICSCDPGRGDWHDGATLIPIAEYPAHRLSGVPAAPPVESAAAVDPRLDFGAVLATLLAQDAPFGWESYVKDSLSSVVLFASARNAASWMTAQDPARLDTPFEYHVRPYRPALGGVVEDQDSVRRLRERVARAGGRLAGADDGVPLSAREGS